uniref:Uncharacterized protein n=1 Tax=Athene cunicularia TaxID=194338 RepID=A0A663M9I8_ATHCN
RCRRVGLEPSAACRRGAAQRPPCPPLVSAGLGDPVRADQAKLICLCQARSSLKKLREDLSSKLENRQGDKQHAQVVLEKQNGSWLHPERLRADSWEDQQEEEEECTGEDVEKIRQTAKRLFTRLQEAEKRHQLEKKAFERTVSQYQEEAEQTSSALRRAERSVAEKEVQVDELQRLLAGMEKEHRSLLLKMKEGEAELARLRSVEGDKLAKQDR